MNRLLLPLLALVALLSVSPACADSSPLIEQLNADGDPENEVVVENSFYRLVLEPGQGGTASSFILKPSNTQMLLPDAKHAAGLFADVFRDQGFGSEWQGGYDVRIEQPAPAPGMGRVIFQRKGTGGPSFPFLTLTRTLDVSADSPAINVRVDMHYAEGGPRQIAFRYGVHHRVASADQVVRYYFPAVRGIQTLTRDGDKGESRQINVLQPPRYWQAAVVQDGPGLAFAMTQSPPESLYAYHKGRIATFEWNYPQTILRHAQTWTLGYQLIPFAGLPHVDGVAAGRAGAIVTEENPTPTQPLKGRLLLAGAPGTCKVDLDWRRAPEVAWSSLPSATAKTQGIDAAAVPFEIPVNQPGTYVIRARIMEGTTSLGAIERAVIIGQPSGRYALLPENAQTDQLGKTTRDGAIALQPKTPIVIRKIMPVDSRLVRGFAHAPVDGRTDTRHAEAGIGEWTGKASLPAVSYAEYNENRGLHITLAQDSFDAIQIRGGWRGKVYDNIDPLQLPADGAAPLFDVTSQRGVFRQHWKSPAKSRRLSFYYEPEQREPLADVSFFEIKPGAAADAAALGIGPAASPDDLLHDVLEARWGPVYRAHQLIDGPGAGLALGKGEFVHLLTAPQDSALGIAAVAFTLNIAEIEPGALLTVRIHDVLDPRREVMGVDLTVPGPGVYTFTLDAPDQVFLPPVDQWPAPPRLDGAIAPSPQLCISLASDAAVKLDRAAVSLQRVARKVAIVEAGAWRKFILRGLFSTMSEPRPWMNLTDKKPVREQIAGEPGIKRYETSLIELLQNVELTRAMLPDDDVAVQYHDWLYQNLDRRKPQPPPVLPEVPGAPQWAVMLRESWRELARIPQWWLDNRLVPGGQFGGTIQDDTDLFQTWQCLSMVESEPLGARLRDAAAQLADAAWRLNLEEGINKKPMDALHAYEEGMNQLSLCAWWFHGDPVHFERAMISARSTLKLMHETPDGRVHFGGKALSIEQARNGYTTELGKTSYASKLFLHPLYEVALYNRNPKIIERFEKWGQTWWNYQKPGAFVEDVDIATGTPVKVTVDARGPTDEWVALHQITRDPRWLEPIIMGMIPEYYWGFTASYGRMVQALVTWPDPVQAKMRAAFAGPGSGYAGFVLNKNRDLINQWCNHTLSWFGRYRYMHTEAEQKTDRVLNFNASAPIACYLGDAPNRNRWVRANAVSYEGLRGDDFAALVWDNSTTALRIAIYNFNDKPIAGVIRTWRLDHGQYRVRIGPDANDDGTLDTPAVEKTVEMQRYSPIDLKLPAKQVTIIDVQQIKPLDDIVDRADLALSPIDTQGSNIIVHNIGGKPAAKVVVNILRGDKVIESQTIEKLDAPLDLVPRMVTLTFKNAKAGDIVVVDPDNAIPEIAEHNNRLTIK